MNTVILFGAGASAFSGNCNPETPPLGNKLFEKLVLLGSPASDLDKKYGDIFRNDFERGMKELSKKNGAYAIPLIRQMGLYLGGFEIAANNAYCRLIDGLNFHLPDISLATLNYDCLLEQALSFKSIDYSLKPFCAENRGPHLLKLHGSSNWLPVIPDNFKLNNVSVSNPEMTLITGVTTPCFARSVSEIQGWHANDRFSSLAPIMCNYAERKNCMTNPEVIDKVQDHWKDTVQNAKLLILIGVRYIEEDTQIWNPVEESLCEVVVVNPDKSEFDKIESRYQNKSVSHIEQGFVESITQIRDKIAQKPS